MKPSVKSSLPIAPILFFFLLLFVALVENWVDYYRSVPVPALRPTLGESLFTSDGALVHVVWHGGPWNERLMAWEIYDETLSTKCSPALLKTFDKEYRSKEISLTAVSEKGPDYWSRRVWRKETTFLWWNGPEGQFDLYDIRTHLWSASLGPDGKVTLAPARPQGRIRLADEPVPSRDAAYAFTPNEPFPRDDGLLLITDDGILRLDTDPQNSYLLNPDPQSLSLKRLFNGKVEGWGRQKEDHRVVCLWFISDGALWRLDFQRPPVRKIPLSDQLAQTILASSSVIVPLENGGFSVAVRDLRNNWWNDRHRESLFLLSSDGSVLRRVEVDRDELNLRINSGFGKSQAILMPMGLLLLPHWKLTSAALIQSAILSLVLMVLVTWHQVRTGRRGSRAFAWSVFTLAAGPAGAVSYVIAHWDKRTEACPGCGKRRPIAQDACPHCNIPWPKPAKSGFEVIEAH